MKERPILFSSPMVSAVRADLKTKTRRVINPQFTQLWGQGVRNTDDTYSCHVNIPAPDGWKWLRCPYGKTGDRLWVRETWRVGAWNSNDQSIAVDYRADGCTQRDWLHVPDYDQFEGLWIASTDQAMAAGLTADESGGFHWKAGEAPTVWRPSIFMPRWACRIQLEVVSVAVERLQNISEEDAIAEGMQAPGIPAALTNRTAFAHLWDTINGKRGYTWDSNPWVWVVEFKQVKQ